MLRRLVRGLGLRTRLMLLIVSAVPLLLAVLSPFFRSLADRPLGELEPRVFAALVVLQVSIMLGTIWLGVELTLLRPLARLKAVADQLGRGQWTARVGEHHTAGRDEISSLGRSLDSMADSLGHMAEVAQLNRLLELLDEIRRVGAGQDSEDQLLRSVGESVGQSGLFAAVRVEVPQGAAPDSSANAPDGGPRTHSILASWPQPLADAPATAPSTASAATAELREPVAIDGVTRAELVAVPAAASPLADRHGQLLRQVAQETASALQALRARANRAAAEAALLAGAARLREAERIGKMGSWRYDAETRRISCSPELLHITGLPADSFAGTLDEFLALVPRDAREAVRQGLRAATRAGDPYDQQHCITTAAGEVKTVRVRAEFERDEKGRVVAANGLIHDISAEAEARAALSERMKELRCLLQVSHLTSQSDLPVPDILTIAVQLLPQAQRYPHLASACIILGDTVYEANDFQASQWMLRADFMAGEQSGRICVAYRTAPDVGGDTPFLPEERELIDTVAAHFADLLTRRAEEERLRERELMYSSIFNQARDATAVIDPDSGAFVEYNRAAHANLGYTRREFAQLRMDQLEVDEAGQPVQRDLRRSVDADANAFSTRHCHRDGRIFEVFLRLWPIQLKGQTMLAAVWADQTEERRIAKELENYQFHLEELVRSRTAALAEARAKAESANTAKSAFLANMSHEIRTPLNAIIGLNHLLQRTVREPDQAERLKKIEASAQHLLGIVNDILDLSKVEAGRMALDPADFGLQDVLQRVVDTVRIRADEKGLALALRIDPGVPPRVHGDPLRLSQVLLNLAQNAVKFTEQGSVELHVALGPRGSQLLRFEVIDTGIGLSPQQKGKLFQPFEQADSSTTRRFGGTGLGLAISARLVALMGGAIGVESQQHHGSCFWFELPLPPTTRESVAIELRPARRTPSDMLRKPEDVRLLLVEDDPLNQEVALELLREAGYRVDVAADGQQALDMAGGAHYDLVLMDLQMPVMDGFAATRALRSRRDYEEVPILAMTASVLAEDRALSDAAGMDDFVAKPVEPDKFFATVARWTGTRVQRGAPQPRGSDASAAVLEQLQGLDGLDVSAGLATVSGKGDHYLALLQRFVDDRAGDTDALCAALASGRSAEAQLLAHSLKGVAGALGARQVQAEAAAVESLLRNPHTSAKDRAAACAKLSRVHLALVAALRKVLPPPAKPTAPTSVDAVRARQVLGELKRLLAEDDVAAVDMLRKNRDALAAALGGGIDRVERLVTAFAFDEALEAIARADSDMHPI